MNATDVEKNAAKLTYAAITARLASATSIDEVCQSYAPWAKQADVSPVELGQLVEEMARKINWKPRMQTDFESRQSASEPRSTSRRRRLS